MSFHQLTRSLVLAIATLWLAAPTQAETLRYMGIDINTEARKPSDTTTVKTNTRFFSPSVGTLAGLSGLPALTGSEIVSGAFSAGPITVTSTGGGFTSTATTSYSIDPVTKKFTLSIPNHSVTGTPNPPSGDNINSPATGANIAGLEGVVYFYAMTPGTLKVTYDYDAPTEEYPNPPTDPYKPSARGRSKQYVYKNSKGTDSGFVPDEIFDPRTGSVTFFESVAPSDDLIALQFDMRLWDGSAPSSITGGFMTMDFTPVPEPASAALLAMGCIGLMASLSGRKRTAD